MIKNIVLLILFSVFLLTKANAQTDLPTQQPLEIDVVPLPDTEGNTSKKPSLNIPSVIDEKPNINFKDSLTKNPVQMLPERELVQAGHDLKIDPRIGKKEKEGSKEFFPDHYLGDVKYNGKFVGVVYRDHEYVDGDRVKVYLNDVVIDPNTLLTGSFKGLNVDLKKGFNRLDFEALNHGTSAPNTAQIQVYDEKGELIYNNKWLLSQGSKATLIITKE